MQFINLQICNLRLNINLRKMLGSNLIVVVAILMAVAVAGKPVTVTQKVLQMNEKDAIVGYTTHTYVRDHELMYPDPPKMPVPPMKTDPIIVEALKSAFPVGSPNITVSEPWVKKAETCSWNSDSNLVHHFEDTIFHPTNDVCALSTGMYTWIVTDDYQVSFGKYANTYEFPTKHANIALMRSGYVAGEITVIPATSHNKAMIYWNLLSGTYSIPISENQNASDPLAYLNNVLYPKMSKVFSLMPCGELMKYGNQNEFFPEVLPSNDYVQSMCINNYFVKYENALSWKKDGSNVCDRVNPAAPCSIYSN